MSFTEGIDGLIIPPFQGIKKAQYFGLRLDRGLILAIQSHGKSGQYPKILMGWPAPIEPADKK
ncbi:MAG TPA: hypothetical protein VMV48_06865 [Gallionellaceae bacterium]|nr:hypothetical protein [Gallionellaceae bacterium]